MEDWEKEFRSEEYNRDRDHLFMYEMDMFAWMSTNSLQIRRVPGGWIFTVDDAACFVPFSPYDPHFIDKCRKCYRTGSWIDTLSNGNKKCRVCNHEWDPRVKEIL